MNRNKLIEDHMKLVYHVIHRYYPSFIGDEDVVSEGYLALCQAAERYDESKSKFSTYACQAILNGIRMYFKKQMRDVEVSSLDFEIKDSDGHSATVHDIIADEDSYKPFDRVEREMFVDTLSKRERDVVALLLEGCDQSEIAERLGIGLSVVSKIVARVKAKWRNVDGEN